MKFGLDDMFIIPAALFGVAWMAVTISLVKYANVGQHTWNLTYENMGLFFKVIFALDLVLVAMMS